MNLADALVLNMTRFIRAPREKVYDAFLNVDALRAWKGARGMKADPVSTDATVGGNWRIVLNARDGSRFAVGGVYRELVPHSRLVFTWEWEQGPAAGVSTLVEVNLHEEDGGTRLEMIHSGFPAPAMRDAHGQGWRSTFNKLTDLLDPRGTAASMVLLGEARSTYTWTARLALAEKGVAYTMQTVMPRTPEILAVHPFGRIPALRDGDIELFETSAILRYVDECFDGPPLSPDTIMGRARGEQWISVVNGYFYDTMVRRFVLQYLFPRGEGGKPDRAVIDKALAEIPRQLAALERGYGGGEYLAGTAPTHADLFVAPLIAYLGLTPEGPGLLAAAPAVQRAHAMMAARPSFAATRPSRG